MSLPIIILGGGGHAKVLIDALHLGSQQILGITDADSKKHGQMLMGVNIIGSDEAITKYSSADILLVNGLGSIQVDHRRGILFDRFKQHGYAFGSVVHPYAIIASDVFLSEGAQVMAGAVIQAGSHIGKNVIINTRAVVDHDCQVGDHAHIAPGAILSGGVRVGNSAHIGTGATVIQEIRVGRDSLVAAGAVVVRDVAERSTVAGIPAKEIKP